MAKPLKLIVLGIYNVSFVCFMKPTHCKCNMAAAERTIVRLIITSYAKDFAKEREILLKEVSFYTHTHIFIYTTFYNILREHCSSVILLGCLHH